MNRSGCILLSLCASAVSAAALADPRDFAPDRPSRSDSPITVPPAYVQIESDFASYTDAGQQLQVLDPTFKYGLTNRTDIELQIGGLNFERDAGGHGAGFGDVTVRGKINLLGDDGGDIALALIPYVKIPTARMPIGNGQVEGGLNVPVLFTLPAAFQLTLEPEVAVLKNTVNDGKQASFTGVANLGRTIVGDLSGFVEIYAQTYADDRAPGPMVTFDTGLAYAVTKNLQLDVGASVGLNHDTPGVNVYSGIATRF
jgi:hypothetical protein